MAFDPDKYLAEKTPSAGFDPDRYLAEKVVPAAKDPSLKDALFPRTAAAADAGRSYPRQAAAAALDLVSGAIRIPAAGGAVLASKMGLTSDTPKFGRAPAGLTMAGTLDNLNQGKDERGNPSFIARMGSNASTPIAAVLPVAKVFQGAGALAKIGQGAAAGAQFGGSGAAVNQAENFAAGRPLSAKEAAKEVAISTALGGGLAAAGQGAKALGSKVVQAALKGGHTGKAEGLRVENVFKNKLGGSYNTMTAKTDAALSKLTGEQDAAIRAASGKTVPAVQLFKDVERSLAQEIQAGKHFGDKGVIEAQLKAYSEELAALADPKTGEIPIALANTLKKKLQADAKALYLAARAGKDTKAMASQAVAASLANKYREAIERAAPDVAKPNAKMSEIIPIAKALARRNTIAGQNNPIGLDELAALDVGAQFVNNGEIQGGLLPFAVRALKSPYVGNGLFGAGDRLQSGRPLRLEELLRQGNTGR